MSDFVFYIAAFLTVAAALNLVFNPNPIYGGLGLIGGFFMIGVLYILIGQTFYGIIQVLVYAGAIMVLFLFIIMLIHPGGKKSGVRLGLFPLLCLLIVIGLCYKLIRVIKTGQTSKLPSLVEMSELSRGSIREFALKLFYDYLFVFEFIGISLIVALVGAIVISKRNYMPKDIV